jgi:uncharacterized protein (DUF1800 family)
MDERAKVAHLLRRYGLGAPKVEMDQYAPLGAAGTLDRLLAANQPETNPADPWEFTVYDAGLMTDPPKFLAWWCLQMAVTANPAREKLALFWHDHLAISSAKVFDGPSVLEYLQIIRKHALGNFRTMLHEVAKSTAMIYYLDTQTSDPGHPNENFARELLELFTMGSGYTELDIQEAARAFCGWAIFFSGLGSDEPFEKQVEAAARQKQSAFHYCFVPARSDAKPKKFLGKTGAFTGEEVIDMALARPETARYVTGKLAEWFMGKKPSAGLHAKLAERFAKDFEIAPVLRVLAESSEFWEEGTAYKSPADFTVPQFRMLNLPPIVKALYGENRDPWKPLRPDLRGVAEGLLFLMSQQGLLLGYPPNVGGWDWGKEWLTTSNVTARLNLAQILLRGDDPKRPIAGLLAATISREGGNRSTEALVAAFLAHYDGEMIDAKQRAVLAQAAEASGGTAALADPEKASLLLTAMAKVLYAAPEYQLQ